MPSTRCRVLQCLAAAVVLLASGHAAAQSVRVINDSEWNIEYLFLSHVGSADWGPDQLGKHVLTTGGGWVEIPALCASYDMRLVDEDGDECIVGGMQLCNEDVYITSKDLLHCQNQTQAAGPVVAAAPTAVRLINSSDWNIEYLFLSPAGHSQWGPDQLGEHVLSAGGGWVEIPAACGYYDLRFVDEDGDECIVGNLHLCNEALDISNRDLLQCVNATQ